MSTRARATHALILAAAVLVGAALRLVGLDRQSFWTDELYVVWEARQPLDVLLDPRIHIHHPPGYRLALHTWMGLGLSETWIRLLAALAGVLLILVVWALARALWPEHPWAASAGAILAATSPFLLHYSQDATTYSWTSLWVAAGFLVLVYAWRTDHPALWAAWALCMAAAMYSHYFSLFPLLFAGVAVLVAGVWSRNRKRLAHAALAIMGAAALYVPWLYIMLTTGRDAYGLYTFPITVDEQPLRWVSVLLFGYARNMFWQVGLGQTITWLLLAAGTLWVGWRLARGRSVGPAARVALVVGWALAAIVGPYLFLRWTTPPEAVDPVRFAAMAVPALLLGVGALLAVLPTWLRLIVLAGWLFVAAAQWRREVSTPSTQDWRGVMHKIATEARPGDALLAFTAFHAGAAAAYYTVPLTVQGGWFVTGPEGEAAYWFPESWRWQGRFDTDTSRSTDFKGEIGKRTAGAQRLWYLAGDGADGTYPPSPAAEQALASLGWQPVREWQHSPLVLKLYARGE